MLPERRYAEWLPGAEATVRLPMLFKVGLAGLGLGTLLLVGSGFLIQIEAFSRYLGWILAAELFFCFLTIMGAVVSTRQSSAHLPPMDDPPAVPHFQATVVLSRELPYGSANGIVSFVDGWLVFTSRSFNFSVRADDVRFDSDLNTARFEFPGPAGNHTAHFPVRKWESEWFYWARSKGSGSGIPHYPTPLASPKPKSPDKFALASDYSPGVCPCLRGGLDDSVT